MSQSPTKNQEEPKMRTVIDAVGEAGSVDLDEELVARAQLADWLDALTGSEITYEGREVALAGYGLVVEFNG